MKRYYEIGYGRPPKSTRFRPGKSGNPRGRTKGLRNFKTDVTATLRALVRITRDGKPRKISTQEAALLRLTEKALGGDIRALERYLQLAQIYNNEELSASSGLSTDDAAILELFKARLLCGAAGLTEEPPTENTRTEPSDSSNATAAVADPAQPKKKSIPRYVRKFSKESDDP